MVGREACLEMPKVELHVHLEGSIRPETVLELAQRNGVSLPADTIEGLKAWYTFRDFPHFVEIYVAVSKCIKTPDDIELIARDFLKGQAEQNVLHSEVTYTASTIDKYGGIPWDEQIDALNRAMDWGKKELGVSMGLIIDIVRGDSSERGLQVAEWAVSGRDKGVLALGLAGPEKVGDAEDFVEAFEYAKAAGLPIVPHAGETKGAESIWEALRLTDCRRVGHGVRCLEDESLVSELISKEVVLEVNPTSNVCLGVVGSFEEHPFPMLVDAGLKVTVNSDDPPMFGTTISNEYWKLSSAFGYGEEALRGFVRTAAENCLLSEGEKAELLTRV